MSAFSRAAHQGLTPESTSTQQDFPHTRAYFGESNPDFDPQSEMSDVEEPSSFEKPQESLKMPEGSTVSDADFERTTRPQHESERSHKQPQLSAFVADDTEESDSEDALNSGTFFMPPSRLQVEFDVHEIDEPNDDSTTILEGELLMEVEHEPADKEHTRKQSSLGSDDGSEFESINIIETINCAGSGKDSGSFLTPPPTATLHTETSASHEGVMIDCKEAKPDKEEDPQTNESDLESEKKATTARGAAKGRRTARSKRTVSPVVPIRPRSARIAKAAASKSAEHSEISFGRPSTPKNRLKEDFHKTPTKPATVGGVKPIVKPPVASAKPVSTGPPSSRGTFAKSKITAGDTEGQNPQTGERKKVATTQPGASDKARQSTTTNPPRRSQRIAKMAESKS